MTIFESINSDIKKAMLAKDKDRLTALRAAKAAFLIAKTEKAKDELKYEDEVKIIQKLIKQRKDTAQIYKNEGRDELYKQEEMEADVLSEYMPKQISNEEIEDCVKTIVTEIDAKSMADMGKVMGIASKKLAGKADNKTISDIVKKILSA